VAEQTGLDVLRLQRFAQQRIGKKVDLADGEIVGGASVAVAQAEFGVSQGGGRDMLFHGFLSFETCSTSILPAGAGVLLIWISHREE
jgi:hypothetical protein